MNKPMMSTQESGLPVDLLLEIVARADVTTLVRCAATGRILRHAILEPAFQRRLTADDAFDPALLLGVSYVEHGYCRAFKTQRVIHSPAPTQLRARLDDADCLKMPFQPVASRDGLLVLRRPSYHMLCCCTRDAFTGHVSHLPPITFSNVSLYLHHVVLSVDDTSRSFELLVADMNKWFYRTFSSEDNNWSDIREVKRLVPLPNQLLDSHSSAVIGRTVYWPFHVNAMHDRDQILALDVDAGEATVMELPPGCSSTLTNRLLLARVRGRLCVLVTESHGIAMWTLTPSVAATGTWSRQVVISKLEMARQVGFLGSDPSPTFSFEAFGGRSGVVILRLFNQGHYLLRLDLGTMEKTPVVTWLSTLGHARSLNQMLLHEVDLNSLLQAMKQF